MSKELCANKCIIRQLRIRSTQQQNNVEKEGTTYCWICLGQ